MMERPRLLWNVMMRIGQSYTTTPFIMKRIRKYEMVPLRQLEGVLQGIDYSSGHYKPDIKAVTMMYQSFNDQGLNVSATNWISRSSWSSKDCEEIQWQDIRIPRLKDTTTLRHSCLEVTTRCPTFVYYDDYCSSGCGRQNVYPKIVFL